MHPTRSLAVLLALAVAPLQADPIFFDGFEPLPPQEPAEYDCNIPGVMPDGFNMIYKTWTQTFSSPDGSPSASYPSGVGFPTPVGSSQTFMTVVPFVPNPKQIVNMYWDDVPSLPAQNYNSRPADGMFFAISPCMGDMRAPDYFGDPYERFGCRKFQRSASIIWTTSESVAESNADICRLEAGKTYYMTISPTDVTDGVQPGESSCQPGYFTCEVGVVLSSGAHD